MHRITGEFSVKMQPESTSEVAAGTGVGRMSLDKQYRGALAASGKGEMLAYMDSGLGSGVYVAIERVEGTLDGKRGNFLLHHRGIMERGAPSLCLLYTSPSPRDQRGSRMPSSA